MDSTPILIFEPRGQSLTRVGSPRESRTKWRPILGVLLVVCLVLAGCGKSPEPAPPVSSPSGSNGDGVVAAARSVIGTPYTYGGNSPATGFDCSGLAQWAYAVNGAALPRSSRDQMAGGSPVSSNEIMPGDLLFFDEGGSPHVGIYAGNGVFIHSPKTGGYVREEEMFKDYWLVRFLSARRFL
ncbi:MAG: NlpC/P60 family protein [Desulfovibrio sp.]|nr:MAG: NlpC/P60 family protein [Desulfovibrio sp.]